MTRLVLIGGTSHVGKTTLAASLAWRLGWSVLSTDQLARHPGRPWPAVRPHVAEHYLKLSADAIYQFLLAHHHNLWPVLRDRLARDLQHAGRPLVLEGSALRPELVCELRDVVCELDDAVIETVWLTAADDVIRERIRQASGYAGVPAGTRAMIDRFIERSLTDNARIVEHADRLGLRRIDAGVPGALERFERECVERLGDAPATTVTSPPDMDLDVEAALIQLQAREPIFYRPELGTSREALQRMTEPDFWEVGASGRRYDRASCVATALERLSAAEQDRWHTRAFRCQRLASNLYLLTYTLVEPGDRTSRRATLWRWTAEGWKAVYHQGTLVADPAGVRTAPAR